MSKQKPSATLTEKTKKQIKASNKTKKKVAKVTQLIKIESSKDAEHRSHQTRLWAEKQIARLSKKQKKNRKKYVIVSAVLSVLNLSVVILACLALKNLVSASHKLSGDNLAAIHAQITLASAAAGVTIIIFVLNISVIIYRGFMKWFIYKEALDAIQVEIMKHKFKKGEYESEDKDIDKLLTNRVETITKSAITNKSHKKWKNLLIKALAGGDYE